MSWEYDLNGVKHKSQKQLSEQELSDVVTQYQQTGVLDPEAQKQEQASYAMNLGNKGLLDSFRMVHNRENGEEFTGTDEELTDEYYEYMRNLEGNFGALLMFAGRVRGDYYAEEEKAALAAMWHNWDNTVPFYKDKGQFWQGIGDHAEALMSDPTTYAALLPSLLSAGTATPAAFGTKKAGQEAAKVAVRSQILKYLGTHFVQGAKHAAPWALGQSLALQDSKGEIGVGEGITAEQTAIDTVIGTATGGVLTTGVGAGQVAGAKILGSRAATQAQKANNGDPNAWTPQANKATDEDAAQTMDAADKFMEGMANPAISNEERVANRDNFLNSVSEATLQNIKRNSKTGQTISQQEARDNALKRLEELGVEDWSVPEILYRLKQLPETHGNFSDFAALAVDVETAMYNQWSKAYKEGTPHWESFQLYNDAVAVASRYSGEAARALAYQKARARMLPNEFAEVMDELARTHSADEAAAAFEALSTANWGANRTASQRAAGIMESAVDVIAEVRTYNLLSAVSTMSVNTFSGYLHMNQKWLQKSLGGLTSLDGRELSEGLLQGINMHRNLVQTIPYMIKAFNSSKGYIDRTRSSAEIGDRGNDIALGTRDMQLISGYKDSMFKQEDESWGTYGVNIVGNIVRALGKRGIAGTDEWIKHAQFRTELQNLVVAKLQKEEGLSFAQAYLKSESMVNALTQEQLNNSLSGAVSNNPLILSALKNSREVAFQNTFKNDPAGAVGQMVNTAIHEGKIGGKQVAPPMITKAVGNAVMPFVRTPTNLFSWLGEMTPALQNFSTHVKQTLESGGPKAREMENQLLLSSMIWASAATAASLNIVSNEGAGSKGQRNVDAAINGTGYAVIGPDGKRYNIRKGDPYARPFLIMARIKDVFEYGDEKTQAELMAALTLATAKAMTEMPTLTGMNQLAELFDEQSAEFAAKKFGANYGTSLLPYTRLIREVLVETGNDVLISEINDLDDILQQPHAFNINGRPDNVKRDAIFGTPIVRNPFAFTPMSGIEVSQPKDDPVLQELKRLHVGVEAPAKTLGGVQMTDYKVDHNSNRNVYDYYQELVGTVKSPETGLNLYDTLATLMSDDEYKSVLNDDNLVYGHRSEGRKTTLVKETIALFRRSYALDTLMADLGPEHPFIVEYKRLNGLDVLTGAGADKKTAEQFFPLNKAQ